MHRSTPLCLLLACLALLMPPGCGRAEPARKPPTRTNRVVVTIPPLAGLIEPILPAGTELSVLIPPGSSPHGFQLVPSDLNKLAEADLVVFVGPALEGSIAQAIMRAAPGRTLAFQHIVGEHGGHAHDDNPDDAHNHGTFDPHLWLDPSLCIELVEAVGEKMPDADPLAVRAQVERIERLDAELRLRLSPFAGRAIITQHGAFGRFTRHFGLRVGAVLRTHDAAEPTPGAIEEARQLIETERAAGRPAALFVEPQLPDASARRIAETLGIPVGTLDPLGDGDWFSLMRSNTDELVRTLTEEPREAVP